MKPISFIHCADIHLEARFTATGLTDIKARQRRHEIQDTFVRIIDKIIELEVCLFFIAGDLFEHEYMGKGTAEFIIGQLKRIPGVDIFISPGNHDPYIPNSYYSLMDWPPNVHIFKGNITKVELDRYNTTIYGTGFTNKNQYVPMLEDIQELDKSKINIFLTHGTLDAGLAECQYHPIQTSKLKYIGFDYVAMGHIHKMSGIERLACSRINYPGSPEPLGFDEPGEHGILYGNISKDKIHIEPLIINKRNCTTLEIDITGILDINEIESQIKQELQTLQDDLVQIQIIGRRDRDLILDIPLMVLRLSEYCFYLKMIDISRPDYPLEELRKQHNLMGVFVSNILNRIELEEEREKRDILEKALYLGLEALDDKLS